MYANAPPNTPLHPPQRQRSEEFETSPQRGSHSGEGGCLAALNMDRETKERLFLDLLSSVRIEAIQFARRTKESMADVVQDACVITWSALDDFDESRGIKVSTYVMSKVRWGLVHAVESRYTKKRNGGIRPRSLTEEVKLPGERKTTLSEVVPDHRRNRMDDVRQREDFDDYLLSCYPDERALLTRIYVDGVEKVEIAEERHVSTSLVSKHAIQALNRIRETCSPKTLRK